MPRTDAVTLADWISGARLRTLGLAIAPVAIGVGASAVFVDIDVALALLALAVALCLQIGVNYANDYSDGIRGTDQYRVGPARLTGSGRVAPKKVLIVALVFFVLAGIAGTIAIVLSGLYWLFLVGIVAILAAWFYTGGKRPYGYAGLGELFVFIFFGPVAVLGTQYLQFQDIRFLNQEAMFGSVGIGLISVAVLAVNNLRDIDTDKQAGKKTLAVILGPTGTKVLYTITLIVIPYLIVGWIYLGYSVAVLVFLTLFLALPATLITWTAKTGKELILALQLTSFTGLSYGLLLGWAFTFI